MIVTDVELGASLLEAFDRARDARDDYQDLVQDPKRHPVQEQLARSSMEAAFRDLVAAVRQVAEHRRG